MRKTWKKTLASLLALALIIGTWSEGFINVKATEDETTNVVTEEATGETAVFATRPTPPVITVTANSIADPVVYDGDSHDAGVTVSVANAEYYTNDGNCYFYYNGDKYRFELPSVSGVKNVGDTILTPNGITLQRLEEVLFWTEYHNCGNIFEVVNVNGSATVVPATYALDCYATVGNTTYYMGAGSISGSILQPSEYWFHGIGGVTVVSQGEMGNYAISPAYKTIKVNGKEYTYDPAQNRANTYTVEWYEVKAVKGCDSIFFGQADGKGSTHYHMNGSIKLQDTNIFNVAFSVAQPGADFAVVSATSMTEGSAIGVPSVAEVIEANGTKYVFTGWCTDAACTMPAAISTLSADTNYYGKYVEVQTLTLVPANTTATYDGNMHVVNGFETTVINGLTVSGLSVYAEGRNAGSYDIAVDGTAVVTDANGKDVTKYYNVVVQDKDLVIAKKAATITSGSATSEYTGDILTNHTVEMEGFLKDEEPTVEVTGSQKMIGSSDNTFEVTNLSDNYNVTYVYGKLTVTAIEGLVISFADVTKTYDGKEITGSYTVNEKLLPGHTVEVELPAITDVDTVVYGETIKIVNAAGADVTEYYADPTVVPGTLTVNPIEGLVITFADLEKTYDRTPLVAREFTVNGALLPGHTIILEDCNSITLAGTEMALANYKIWEGMKDVTSFYKNVVVNAGTLTVNKIQIKVTSASDSKEYDGEALTNNNVTVTGAYLEKDEPTYEFTGTQTELGTSKNAFTVKFASEVPDSCYEVTTEFGTLTVNKITGASITFDDITKDYDAQKLVGTFETAGFLAAHKVVVATPAEITNAGNVTNTGAYAVLDAEDKDVSSYYDTITVTDGILTVNPLKVTVAVKGQEVNVYYTGFELQSEGYDVTAISSDLYSVDDFAFNGNAVVKATMDRSYAYMMGLDATQFVNNNSNFDVTFEVTDGYLKIYYLEGVSPAREDGNDTPVAPQPEVQEPEVPQPEVQEPEVEEPVVEEPEVEEPVVEEPVVEEPVVEEVEQTTEPEVEVEVVGDETNTEAQDNLVQIEDEETPLANMDLDGDGNGPIFWILLAGVLATVALFIFFVIIRRKKEEEEEA